MRFSKLTAATVAIAFALTLEPFPAQAADLSNLLQGVSGNLGGWAEFDARKDQLSQTIDTAVAGGQLSQDQATQLKKQLSDLNDSETKARAPGSGKFMGFVQSLNFNNQLNALTNQVQTAMNQHVSSLPNVDQLQSDLSRRIETDIAAGKFSDQEAQDLRSAIQHVAGIESAFKAETGGQLTPKQVQLLADAVNKVQAQVEQQEKLADSAAPAIVQRSKLIQQKIDDSVRSGRLTTAEGDSFRQSLSDITKKQTTFQGANGLLTGAQVFELAGDLDALDHRIEDRLAQAPQPDREWHHKRWQSDATAGAMPDAREQGVSSAALGAGGATNSQPDSRRPQDGDRHRHDFGGRYRDQSTNDSQNAPPADTSAAMPEVAPQRHLSRRVAEHEEGQSQPNSATPAIASATPPATTAPAENPTKAFTDTQGFWGQTYVESLAGRGIIGGFPDGSFHPNDEITRAQFAAIAASALSLPPSGSTNNFTDVPAKHWAAHAIGAASQAGLITGFPDGTFKPEDRLTRAQALVILSKALSAKGNAENAADTGNQLSAYTDQSAVPKWALPSVSKAAGEHIIVSFPNANEIRPNALATRGEVAAMMYQTLYRKGTPLPPVSIGVLQAPSQASK